MLHHIPYRYYNVSHEVAHPESFVANASFYQMLHDAKVRNCFLSLSHTHTLSLSLFLSLSLSLRPAPSRSRFHFPSPTPSQVKTIKLDCRLLSASTRMHDKDAKHGSVVDSVKLFCEPTPITATV